MTASDELTERLCLGTDCGGGGGSLCDWTMLWQLRWGGFAGSGERGVDTSPRQTVMPADRSSGAGSLVFAQEQAPESPPGSGAVGVCMHVTRC